MSVLQKPSPTAIRVVSPRPSPLPRAPSAFSHVRPCGPPHQKDDAARVQSTYIPSLWLRYPISLAALSHLFWLRYPISFGCAAQEQPGTSAAARCTTSRPGGSGPARSPLPLPPPIPCERVQASCCRISPDPPPISLPQLLSLLRARAQASCCCRRRRRSCASRSLSPLPFAESSRVFPSRRCCGLPLPASACKQASAAAAAASAAPPPPRRLSAAAHPPPRRLRRSSVALCPRAESSSHRGDAAGSPSFLICCLSLSCASSHISHPDAEARRRSRTRRSGRFVPPRVPSRRSQQQRTGPPGSRAILRNNANAWPHFASTRPNVPHGRSFHIAVPASCVSC